MADKFDLVVVGGGPGGYVAAIRAAQLKQKVAIVEKDKLGGLCLNWGCIPSKALIRSAEVYELIRKASDFGVEANDVTLNFTKVVKHSRQTANRLNKGVEYLMKKNKITTYSGVAHLGERGVVAIEMSGGTTEKIHGDQIIICTGGKHRSVPGVEFDHKKVINSTDAMVLKKVPKSMVIIGGGPIGVEFGYMFNAFGAEVTIVEMLPHILPLEDEEIIKTLALSFKKRRIKLETNARVESVKTSAKGVEVEVTTEAGSKKISAELALIAVGFSGNTEGLGLEQLGIEVEKTFIKTNEFYQTAVDGYYAVGDVIGPPLLAHVASAEGIVAAEHIAGLQPRPVDYNNIPGCTYCHPQVASVGLTEKAAKEAGYEVRIGRFPFRAVGKAIANGETEGMVKLIFDAKYDELLGAHIIGAEATDLIAELVTARTLETTAYELMKTMHAHPTLPEAVMEAAAEAHDEAINF